jgi:hypothetical protein
MWKKVQKSSPVRVLTDFRGEPDFFFKLLNSDRTRISDLRGQAEHGLHFGPLNFRTVSDARTVSDLVGILGRIIFLLSVLDIQSNKRSVTIRSLYYKV